MRKVAHFTLSLGNGRELGFSRIEKFQETTNMDSDAREFIPTTVEYITDDGMHLEPMKTGAYRIIETGEIGMCKL